MADFRDIPVFHERYNPSKSFFFLSFKNNSSAAEADGSLFNPGPFYVALKIEAKTGAPAPLLLSVFHTLMRICPSDGLKEIIKKEINRCPESD